MSNRFTTIAHHFLNGDMPWWLTIIVFSALIQVGAVLIGASYAWRRSSENKSIVVTRMTMNTYKFIFIAPLLCAAVPLLELYQGSYWGLLVGFLILASFIIYSSRWALTTFGLDTEHFTEITRKVISESDSSYEEQDGRNSSGNPTKKFTLAARHLSVFITLPFYKNDFENELGRIDIRGNSRASASLLHALKEEMDKAEISSPKGMSLYWQSFIALVGIVFLNLILIPLGYYD